MRTKGISWDEPINREISHRTKDWFSPFESFQDVSFPRCLQESKPEKSISVQKLVDASSEAYGEVSFPRSEYAFGCYGARIIASKTRVAPFARPDEYSS